MYFRKMLTYCFVCYSDSKSTGDPKFMEAFGKNDILGSVIEYILISVICAKIEEILAHNA